MKTAKFLKAGIIATILAAFLYFVLCVQLLSSIQDFPLVTTRYVNKTSETYPFQFPVPDFLIDGYWSFRGEKKLQKNNAQGNRLALFIAESIDYHERNEYAYNRNAAQLVLNHYVCERVESGFDVQELRAYAGRFKSRPLMTALQSCTR